MSHISSAGVKRSLRRCIFAIALSSMFAATAAAQPDAGIALKDLLEPQGNERERELIALIEQALAGEPQTGALRWVEDRELAPLALQQAVLAAIEKNLTLAIGRQQALQARTAILEARAIFDPVFALSVNYERQKTYDRTLTGTVRAQVFNPAISGDPAESPQPGEIILSPEAERLSGVDRIVFPNTRSQVERVQRTIFASREDPTGATEAWTYSIDLEQQLPWGVRYNVAAITTDRDVFYNARGDSFGASWSSELLLNLEIPLPGSQDFGPYAIADTALKLAQQASEASFWAFKSLLNETLLRVNLAYLNLLETLANFEAAVQNRRLLEGQQAQIARLLRAQLATRYDVAQINAALARARAQQEVAATAFIAASDTLAPLIEVSSQAVRERIYLPEGYTLWLDSPLAYNADAALALAKRYRPELQVSRVELETDKILERQALQETRPDVTLDIALEALQDGSVYGYKSYGESIEALTDPDVFNQSYGLRYRYPIGNRAFKARLAQAQGQVKVSRLGLQASYNDVIQEVNDALISLQTAQARIISADAELKAARQAYDSLERLRAVGSDVNTNELVVTLRRLLDAKFTQIAARIDRKRAESSLLAAQGLLAQHYPRWIARNGFERYRLRQLAESSEFEYFLR